MNYLDLEDRDNDMLSMEDWDYICDEAMDEEMRSMSYRPNIKEMTFEEFEEWYELKEKEREERELEFAMMGWRKVD